MNKKYFVVVLIIFLLVLKGESVFAQPLEVIATPAVTGQTFNTCNGVLYPAGGVTGSGYTNGENWIVTICPDVPGDAINLDFITFALSTQNTAPPPGNNIDNFTIYDGNTTGAPTLGTYTGNGLQGLVVSCTNFNTSGCLTIEFHSNSAGTGNFAATISCVTPCQRPTAVLDSPIPAAPDTCFKICTGESMTFDGSSSFAAAGFNIAQYTWNFDDGTIDSTSGPVASHTFNQEGEFLVDLYILDDNGCAATNRVTVQVLVGTTPSFAGTTGDTSICLGETVCLDGVVTGTLYTGTPNALVTSAYLPDDVGQCFSSTIDFNIFAPGQTLTNPNQLLDICVLMEHSYIGDLVASVICPDGTQVILYQQGGGWNSLGEPIDVSWPASLDPPGIGYDYCWSDNATLGTWADCGSAGATPNLINLPNGTQTLAPGTYSPLNPLSGLVGCPLNGTWELEFCDLWGADDGWVFDWEINFDPALYPNITQFTPQYGAQCDSTNWTPDNAASAAQVSSTSPDCNQICITPNAVGSYSYTFSATDDFGCTYTTTTTVTVTPPPTVDAGVDQVVCPNIPTQLNATVSGAGTTCNFTLMTYDSFGDGWNGGTLTILVDGVPTTYWATGLGTNFTFSVPAGATIELQYSAGAWENENSYDLVDCSGNIMFSDGPNPMTGSVFTGMNGAQIVYSWTPTTGLSDPTIANPTATITAPTTYYVTIWENGHPLCDMTDSISLTINPAVNAGIDGVITVCYNDPAFDMFTLLTGSPNATGSWFDASSNPISSTYDPPTMSQGVFYYIVPAGGGCPPDTATVTVTELLPNDPLCCVVTYTETHIDMSCFGVCDGEIHIINTNGVQFSFDGGLTTQTDSSITGLCAGVYDVQITDAGGCITSFQVTIAEPAAVTATIAVQDVSCFGFSDGQLTVTPNGGVAPFTYLWDDNCAQTTAVCGNNCVPAGNYCVTVTDANGCTTQVCDVVSEPTLLTMNFTTQDASCFAVCDGQATAVINGGTPPYTYNWNGAGSAASQQTTLCAATHDLIVTDANGCVVDSIDFVINQPPQVIINSVVITDETCYQYCDGSITITAANATNYSINGGATFSANPAFIDLCTGNYVVVAEDANGCSVTQNAIVAGPGPVNADFTFGPQPTTIFDPIIYFTNTSTGAVTYLWNFNNIDTSTQTNPSFEFTDDTSGIYNVCLYAFNANGCVDSVCYDVIISEEFVLYAPNAFTPNGDGHNDIFFVYGNDINPEDYELLVFNRWGEVIFSASSLSTGWDGSFKGMPAKQDVYVWKVKTSSLATGEFHEKYGHVTLFR
ncbi:MAG: PKD domain-containing protein [Bacteroidota bacterium]